MELVLSQFEFVRWAFSPAGLLIVALGLAVLLSGLPGAILPNLEATASARRAFRQRSSGEEAAGHNHRERMGA